MKIIQIGNLGYHIYYFTSKINFENFARNQFLQASRQNIFLLQDLQKPETYQTDFEFLKYDIQSYRD